jgi:hypothetical protein
MHREFMHLHFDSYQNRSYSQLRYRSASQEARHPASLSLGQASAACHISFSFLLVCTKSQSGILLTL